MQVCASAFMSGVLGFAVTAQGTLLDLLAREAGAHVSGPHGMVTIGETIDKSWQATADKGSVVQQEKQAPGKPRKA